MSGLNRNKNPKVSKIPGEGALDGVRLRVRGKFARIGKTELRPGAEAPVEAGLDQRRVARDRHPGNRERSSRALEASAADGVTSPKAYCQANVARGTSTVPLASGMKVAMRTPSEE